MSDADDQLGGSGGATGKSPEQQGREAYGSEEGREERRDAGEKTDGEQAAANREDDPPA